MGKISVVNPTSVLPLLRGCDEWWTETLWWGLQSSARSCDVLPGLCFCIWQLQLFLCSPLLLSRCNLTSVLNETIIMGLCACGANIQGTMQDFWELARGSLRREKYISSAFWKGHSVRRTLLKKIFLENSEAWCLHLSVTTCLKH